ncbi:hypothetical protein KSS87_002928 [Heliosperma pusillum]|nr:hypothetical protein KSS87_002928 [Heliosperma pusillum]
MIFEEENFSTSYIKDATVGCLNYKTACREVRPPRGKDTDYVEPVLLNFFFQSSKRCLRSCKRLLWHGHQVMFNQLASWMVYGILQDPHDEFFIRSQDDSKSEKELPDSDMHRKMTRLKLGDSSLVNWHLGFHISLVPNGDGILSSVFNFSAAAVTFVQKDMLPEYINMRVAESILFAGKAIRVLRNPSPGFFVKDSFYHHKIPRQSRKNQGLGDHFSFQKDTQVASAKLSVDDLEPSGEDLLSQSEADKIETMLQDLKDSTEFHKRSFECAVDSIRSIAASHLWQLVVVRADLNGHLKALKDYFLLAKGDFFQCFLEESRQLMRLPPRQSTAEADLLVPFQLAALKTISDDDKYFSRVSLRMPSAVNPSQVDVIKSKVRVASSSTAADLDGWDGITLEYSIDWPLQLFFSQEVLSKYCRVFQYLLRLKRTQMELEKSWASVMHQDHSDFAEHRNDPAKCSTLQQRRQRFRPMWRVREHMAFLIRNLQFYIQVDVIESQWNLLQNHIQDSRDFTELVNFHQEYLSALISQSFLDIGSVSRILDSIMKLCLQYCWSLENQESPNTAQLDHITEMVEVPRTLELHKSVGFQYLIFSVLISLHIVRAPKVTV